MGGTIGFLKTLQRVCSELNPRAVYIAWEGGGSSKRRAIFSEYKLGRLPEKLNRFYDDDIPESDENRKHQMLVLIGLLKHTPACQLYAADCEGDDVIAFLCRGRFRGQNKVIVSSDKDMYQLLDDTTRVYSLYRKIYVTKEDVLRDYQVTAKNFALAKALCGDASDNIPGVPGMGYKTLVKRLPFVGLEEDIILQQVFDYCEAHKKESIHYRRILESQSDVKRNWRLIYLDDHTLTNAQAQKIDYVIDTFEPRIGKIEFMRLLAKEGLNDFDVNWFYYAMNGVEGLNDT